MRGTNNSYCDVYLDNAATSFPKPPSVIKELYKCLKYYCGNPGRSGHGMSIAAADKIYEAREIIASFFEGAVAERVCFTQNATSALNTVTKGLIKKKTHIIISDTEHNSVLRPLGTLKDEYGVEISEFDTNLPLRKAILAKIRENTEYLICNLASNVTGDDVDFEELKSISREYGLTLIVDASQAAGHKTLSFKGLERGALCSAGHKALFGIQGSAFFILSDKLLPSTLLEGGSGSDSFNIKMPSLPPERYEAGTLSCPSIVSLSEGIKFINSIGLENIEKKLTVLTNELFDRLSSIKEISIYGAKNGICSFNIDKYSSFEAARLLSDKSIALRGGFHCAPSVHKKLKTEKTGAVRASLSYFNSKKDTDKLYKAIKEIL